MSHYTEPSPRFNSLSKGRPTAWLFACSNSVSIRLNRWFLADWNFHGVHFSCMLPILLKVFSKTWSQRTHHSRNYRVMKNLQKDIENLQRKGSPKLPPGS